MKLLFKDMRSKLLIALALLATVMIPEVKATEPTDTIYNPPMFFTGMPKNMKSRESGSADSRTMRTISS